MSHTVGVVFFFYLAEVFSCHFMIILNVDQLVSENIKRRYLELVQKLYLYVK